MLYYRASTAQIPNVGGKCKGDIYGYQMSSLLSVELNSAHKSELLKRPITYFFSTDAVIS